MDNYTLWSLRLGYTGKHSAQIQQKGIRKFLEDSFASAYSNTMPQFLQNEPKTLKELDTANKLIRTYTEKQKQEYAEDNLQKLVLIKSWWLNKMIYEPYVLREKMTCLLHNHFVINGRKVKVPYWVYQHNALLREHAFGNFRELTKLMVKSNAMISYLNNNTNKKGKVNENLSRELLELFTLGIGNYKEQDIVQGAKALAGLTYGDAGGVYNAKDESNETITYLGKKGRFKADDIVNIIFEQPSAPYLFTRKVLQWFIYDTPPEELVKYYGDYFRQKDFEIKPLLTKIYTEEFEKKTSGAKIKDPLVYILQLTDEAGLKKPNPILVNNFIRSQGMDLYGQPNVKGWAGGYSWLTTQVYLARSKMADRLCLGYNFPVKPLAAYEKYNLGYSNEPDFKPEVKWKSSGPGNKAVINQLKERLLFDTDEALQKNFEQMLKYDFDPKSPTADEAVLRLFNYMVKTPEFQLI